MLAIPYISTTGSVATAVSGTGYTNLGTAGAHEVLIVNRSGTQIDVKTANSSTAVPLADGASLGLGLASSLAEVAVRRTDVSATPATVHFVSRRFYQP